MVVLAVTWMAKVGHEAEVAALFEKLTEQSRKEPGCAMYQAHRHKTEPRRFFIYEQYNDDAAPGIGIPGRRAFEGEQRTGFGAHLQHRDPRL